jgi:hypothetical protein
VTEGLTLLPGNRVDKRTKEVFVLSLERMNGLERRSFAPFMDRLDGRSSVPRMVHISTWDCYVPRNSACPESVFFLRVQHLILNALSRDTPQSTKHWPLSDSGHC